MPLSQIKTYHLVLTDSLFIVVNRCENVALHSVNSVMLKGEVRKSDRSYFGRLNRSGSELSSKHDHSLLQWQFKVCSKIHTF